MRGDLTRGPEVGANLPSWEFPLAGVVNLHGKRSPAFCGDGHILSGLDSSVDGPGVTADDGGQMFTLGLEGGIRDPHAFKTNTFRRLSKGCADDFRKVAELQVFTETVAMPYPGQFTSNVWPQRPRFIELVKAKEKAGTPFDEIAKALGRAPSTLQGYIEQWTRPPAKQVIERAVEYFHVHISELWGPEMTKDQVELMNAYSMVREALGYEKAESMGDEGVLRYYRAAKNMLAATSVVDVPK